jgi:hypothetical protein
MCTLTLLHVVQSERTIKELVGEALSFLEGPDESDWMAPASPEHAQSPIPKILHHIFLDGEDEYQRWVCLRQG